MPLAVSFTEEVSASKVSSVVVEPRWSRVSTPASCGEALLHSLLPFLLPLVCQLLLPLLLLQHILVVPPLFAQFECSVKEGQLVLILGVAVDHQVRKLHSGLVSKHAQSGHV